MAGAIQCNAALHQIKTSLERPGVKVIIPQSMLLIKDGILGCTIPMLSTHSWTCYSTLAMRDFIKTDVWAESFSNMPIPSFSLLNY